MPVEIVRRGPGKKYPAAKLKRVAAGILKLLKEDNGPWTVPGFDNLILLEQFPLKANNKSLAPTQLTKEK